MARSIKGIKENLASMKRANNAWADRYVRDVGWLLNELDRVRDEAANLNSHCQQVQKRGEYSSVTCPCTERMEPYYERLRNEAATAALEQERQRIREIIKTVTPYNGYVWREDILAAMGDDKEQQR